MNRTVPDPPSAGDHVAPTDDPENIAARHAAWKSYTVDRDAVYQGRLDLEERYKWATAFGPDKDLAIAQAAFRKQDPDRAKWVDSDPPTLHDIIASYHRDLRQEFERLEHSRFRDRALARGRRVLDEALARHEGRSPLGVVHEVSKERLACAWLKDVEKAVDDHWITARDRSGRNPGRDGTRDPGDPPDAFASWDERFWDERFKDLAGTIPHRISHELEKSMVPRRATVDFHRLAGHPADLCGRRYDVSAKQFDEVAKDFCGDTIAAYEWVWGT